MPLEAGQQLLHYRLIEQIGEGGMGVVWKALDTTLEREVAIKVLPETLSQEPERVARFEREAKLLAALNHPGIAALHSVHEASGLRFLSMELVPGEDLGERLARGSLPLEEGLELARQVAESLEAAHERGVVHRDLKPANVKLTPEGRAKVLDLGLAKAMSPDSSMSGEVVPEHSPTLTTGGTAVGVIMGTAAYMSPEQARGKPVDRRTDIWSFGVLLFEMLAGRKLFAGETVSDILAEVLKTEPDWDALPPETPAAVQRMLRRCLSRNPATRLQSMGDARVILEEVLADPSSWVEKEPEGARRASGVLRWALVPMALIAFLAGWFLRPEPPTSRPPTLLAEIPIGADQHLVHLHRPGVALSPDGRTLAYVAGPELPPRTGSRPDEWPDIWVRPLDQGQARLLVEDALYPTFSPDGRWIAYRDLDDLKKVPLEGGDPITLTDWDSDFGMTWVDDETIVFHRDGVLYRIPASGGEPTRVTTLDEEAFEASHRLPHALPDGETVLFTIVGPSRVALKMSGYSVHAVSLRTGERKPILEDASDARYVASGHIVFAREGVIMAAPFDADALEVIGPEVRMVEGVVHSVYCGNFRSATAAAQFAVSEQGLLAFLSGTTCPPTPQPVLWLDRNGKEEPIDVPEGRYLATRVSPAGDRLLLTVAYPTEAAVWTYDLQRKAMRKQTFEQGVGFAAWGPGPDHITYNALEDSGRRLYIKPLDSGPGSEEPFGDLSAASPGSWDRAGEIFVAIDWSGENRRIVGMTRDGTVRELVSSTFRLAHPKISPDGRLLAYLSAESGEPEIYVRRVDGEGQVVQVSTAGGWSPIWSVDGSELFYRPDQRSFYAASIRFDGETISSGNPTLLFDQRDYAGSSPTGTWSVGPDGRFSIRGRADEAVLRQAVEGMNPRSIRIVQGWFDQLERQAPRP